MLFCGGYEGRIVTLEFDTAARTLQAVATSKEGGNAPTWLELSEDRKHLCERTSPTLLARQLPLLPLHTS